MPIGPLLHRYPLQHCCEKIVIMLIPKIVLTTAYSYLGVWQGKLLMRVANL